MLVRVKAPGNDTTPAGCDWNEVSFPSFIPLGYHGPTTQIPEALNQTLPVPEPSTFLLLAAGLGLVGIAASQRQLTARG